MNFMVYMVVSISIFNDLHLTLSAPVRQVELMKGWTLQNQNGSIRRTNVGLPSGVYSAFDENDPDKVLYSYNDVNMKWIAYDNWTYSMEFDRPDGYDKVKFIYLTFHGIDTIAKIILNNITLGESDNMFVRYSYNIKEHLNQTNQLQVYLTSPVISAEVFSKEMNYTPPNCPPERYHGECHMNFLRKMQASFSWDWGLSAPSMGIWKPVVLEMYDIAIIRDIDVTLTKEEKSWTMDIRVFLETGLSENFFGELVFYAVELFGDPVKISYKDKPISPTFPVLKFSKTVDARRVQLWWPNGYGKQKLYHLHFTWKGWLESGDDPRKLSVSQKSIRIGFRTLELVQNEIYNGDSFYFRVNGINMFMKGTNYIPSHILPEHGHNQVRIKHLLESVKDANMNMIRVWGGGIYESDYFYDMADYLGILIWQDMMFACAMYPVFPKFLESVRQETIQNARRIAFHPSIAVWAGNNENEAALVQNWYNTSKEFERFSNEYKKLYVETIYYELSSLISHSTRPIPLISSPSNGRKTMEDGYISKDPQSPNYGDIHFYEYLKDGWDPNIYKKPRFSSEYGFQSLPSMNSWQRVLGPNDDLAKLMDHRQHFPYGSVPILGLILRHLPLPLKDDPLYIEALIYFSQISQAVVTKTETEVYRSQRSTIHNTMGALYWQLNDVWIAPSWSSIDFNGNYKILHYWAKEFMAPISIIAHLDSNSSSRRVDLYVVRDTISPETLDLTVNLKLYTWSQLIPKKELHWPITINSNTVKHIKSINLDNIVEGELNANNCFLQFSLFENQKELARNYFFPDHIKNAEGMIDPDIEVEISSTFCQIPINSASLAIKIKAPALFVYIEIVHENITTYKLSRNGYVQVEPIQSVHVEFSKEVCVEIKQQHIKILTVNQFMK